MSGIHARWLNAGWVAETPAQGCTPELGATAFMEG